MRREKTERLFMKKLAVAIADSLCPGDLMIVERVARMAWKIDRGVACPSRSIDCDRRDKVLDLDTSMLSVWATLARECD